MPHPDKVKKLVSILKALKKQLSLSGAISLSLTLRSHKLPADYAVILLSMGAIIKMDSGKRGPSSYCWNKEFSPDYDLAYKVISAYNKRRNNEADKRKEKEQPISNKALLENLRQTLITISVRMDRIEKVLTLGNQD